jgi:hypothetical protein
MKDWLKFCITLVQGSQVTPTQKKDKSIQNKDFKGQKKDTLYIHLFNI